MRVLHLAEAFSAGVATAIEGYLDNTPAGVETVVCGYRRPGVQVGDNVEARARFVELPHGKPQQLRAVARLLRSDDFDVVHLHSSWAGAFGRITAPRRRPRIVYTPHCFGFDRKDLPGFARTAFRAAERAFGMRVDVIAACSANELRQAQALLPRTEAVLLPYVLPHRVTDELRAVPRSPQGGEATEERPLDVCLVGRVDQQKDPNFCIAVATALRELRSPVSITWIGGGRPDLESQLRAHGVDVTGWTTRSVALERLARADVFLHTAAWEGLPLTFLEAATLDVPMALRQIPAVEEVGVPTMAAGPEDLAKAVDALVDSEYRATVRDAGRTFLQEHRPEDQRSVLAHLYG